MSLGILLSPGHIDIDEFGFRLSGAMLLRVRRQTGRTNFQRAALCLEPGREFQLVAPLRRSTRAIHPFPTVKGTLKGSCGPFAADDSKETFFFLLQRSGSRFSFPLFPIPLNSMRGVIIVSWRTTMACRLAAGTCSPCPDRPGREKSADQRRPWHARSRRPHSPASARSASQPFIVTCFGVELRQGCTLLPFLWNRRSHAADVIVPGWRAATRWFGE